MGVGNSALERIVKLASLTRDCKGNRRLSSLVTAPEGRRRSLQDAPRNFTSGTQRCFVFHSPSVRISEISGRYFSVLTEPQLQSGFVAGHKSNITILPTKLSPRQEGLNRHIFRHHHCNRHIITCNRGKVIENFNCAFKPDVNRRDADANRELTPCNMRYGKSDIVTGNYHFSRNRHNEASMSENSECHGQSLLSGNNDSQGSTDDDTSRPGPRFGTISNQESVKRMLAVTESLAGTTYGYPFSFQRFLGRWVWGAVLSRLIHHVHEEPMYLQLERGALQAIKFFFEKISNREWSSLEPVIEPSLLNHLRTSIENLSGNSSVGDAAGSTVDETITMNFAVSQVSGCRMVGLSLIFGGFRDEISDDMVLVPAMSPIGPIFFILRNGQRRLLESGDRSMSDLVKDSRLLRDSVERGATARVDIIFHATQRLSLHNSFVAMTSASPETFHLVRFEAKLRPAVSDLSRRTLQPYSISPDGWRLVDFNYIRQGNFPFNPSLFCGTKSERAVQRETANIMRSPREAAELDRKIHNHNVRYKNTQTGTDNCD